MMISGMAIARVRSTRPALALMAALVLGACAEGTQQQAAPEAAATGQATTAEVNPNWLDLTACAGEPNVVHYRLAGTELAVPQAIVRRLVLVNAGETADIDQGAPLAAQVPRGTGCRERPLPVGGVITRAPYDTDLLEGTVSLFPLPQQIVREYSDLIGRLQGSVGSNACEEVRGGMIACTGQENFGGNTTDVAYLIAADPNERLNFGAPLFARCELRDGAPVGCNLGDLASPQVFFDATLTRVPGSAAEIRAAHTAVASRFGALGS